MTTLEELRARRPVDLEEVEKIKASMAAEERAYQLRELRQLAGLTQKDVAKAIQVGQNRVSQIESGHIEKCRVETLSRYLHSLGLELVITAKAPDGEKRINFTPVS